MKIKYIIGIVIIVLLSINAVLVYDLITHNDSNSVNFEGITFEMPKNYSLGDNPDQIVLNNGSDKIIIIKLVGNDTNSLIKTYLDGYSNNYSISAKDFDSDIDCKKTVSIKDNFTIVKYWFEINNQIYQIQMHEDNSKSDEIARNLINSMAK